MPVGIMPVGITAVGITAVGTASPRLRGSATALDHEYARRLWPAGSNNRVIWG